MRQQTICVNEPFTYGGIKVYQSSFGYLVDVQGESKTGWMDQQVLPQGERMSLQNPGLSLSVFRYIPDCQPEFGMNSKSLRPDNPKVVYAIHDQGKLVDMGVASFQQKIEFAPDATVQFNRIVPYSIFTIKRDPGLPLAAAGGILLMVGACLTLLIQSKKRQGDTI